MLLLSPLGKGVTLHLNKFEFSLSNFIYAKAGRNLPNGSVETYFWKPPMYFHYFTINLPNGPSFEQTWIPIT